MKLCLIWHQYKEDISPIHSSLLYLLIAYGHLICVYKIRQKKVQCHYWGSFGAPKTSEENIIIGFIMDS